MKRRILSLLLVLAMFISCAPYKILTVFAAEENKTTEESAVVAPVVQDADNVTRSEDLGEENRCGNNLTWSYDSSAKVLTISGTGEMYNYLETQGDYETVVSTAPWASLSEEVTSVVIEEGVTCIGSGAFADFYALTKVWIPSTLEEIQRSPFLDCVNLEEIHITDFDAWCGITFYNSESNPLYYAGKLYVNGSLLTHAVFPEGTTGIKPHVLAGCEDLVSVSIPDGVEEIGLEAFLDCVSLTSLYVPASVRNIDSNFCGNCSAMTEIIVHEDNKNYYVDSCGVLYSRVGKELIRCPGKYSGDYEILNDTEIIIFGAFSGCRELTSVTLPSSIVGVHTDVFANTPKLTEIRVDSNNSRYYSDAYGVLYSISSWDASRSLIRCPGGFTGSYKVPDTVSYINSYAFDGCSGLTDIELPDNITIYEGAFQDCTALTSVRFPSGMDFIPQNTFSGCTGLRQITIPEGIRYIHREAFRNCVSLTEVTIPLSVIGYGSPPGFTRGGLEYSFEYAVGTKAFFGCSSLKHAHFLGDRVSIGRNAFDYCGADFTICYVDGAKNWEKCEYPVEVWDCTFTTTASCYEGGAESYFCTQCNGEYYRTTEAYSHDFAAGSCSRCGISAESYLYGSGACGENLTWELNGYGVLTIAGTGDMYDDGAYDIWGDFIDKITAVTIPEGCTSIGENAFIGCSNLKAVTIPDTATRIGKNAFFDCISLASISLPEGMTEIAYQTFAGCESLTEIKIPDSVTEIGTSAFHSCIALEGVTIPQSVTTIGSSAFIGCSSMTYLILPSGLTTIENYAFEGCHNLTDVTIPDSVTAIESGAFGDCDGLTEVTIPSGVVYLGDYSFRGCSGLHSVTLLEGVTCIGAYAFNECESLRNVTIPGTVTEIGQWAFSQCDMLTVVEIPFGVVTIGDSAFYDDDGLTRVTIPDSVEKICASAFRDCDSLTEMLIPESVTYIGQFTFAYCDNLLSVNIPSGLKTIYEGVFYECNSLPRMTVPSGVSSIYRRAFGGCDSLLGIWVEEGNAYYTNSDSGILFDKEMTSLIQFPGGVGGSYSIPHEVTTIFDYAFVDCYGLTDVTFPDSVTTIGEDAFYNCDGLTEVILPDSVTIIDYRAFGCCDGLESLTIGEGVTTIGAYAFSACTSLRSATIPESVATIDGYAFGECSNLESIRIMNPDCSLASGESTLGIPAVTTVFGYRNSTAEEYAQEYDFCFAVMTDCENGKHDYTETVVKPVTCTENGENLYHCNACSNEYTVILEAWGHQYYVDRYLGYKIYKCDNCDDSHREDLTRVIREEEEITVDILDSEDSIYFVFTPQYTESYTFFYYGGYDMNCYLYDEDEKQLAEYRTVTWLADKKFSITYSLNAGETYYYELYSYNEGTFAVKVQGDHTFTSEELKVGSCTEQGQVFHSCGNCGYSYTEYTYYIHDFQEGICTLCGEEESVTGRLGSLTWTYYTVSGTLVISGDGNMPYYNYAMYYPWFPYRTEIRKIVIEDGITTVSGYAFENYSNVIDVIIPDSVTEIETYAFGNCTGLTEVTIPRSVKTISGRAFHGCSMLQHVHFIGDMPSMDNWSFYRCASDLKLAYIEGTNGWENCNYETEVWDHTSTMDCTSVTYTCNKCDGVYSQEREPDHKWTETVATAPTCVAEGVKNYICTVCGDKMSESIPVTGVHIYENGICTGCGEEETGSSEPIEDPSLKINHTLNLASDISVNFPVSKTLLAGYDMGTVYMDATVAIYDGNEKTGTKTTRMYPVEKGDYYYFTLTGLTAVHMNDDINSVLYGVKGGRIYCSPVDKYSIATYAYSQMSRTTMPEGLKILCADLLRYGAKTQIFKSYRTDALADSAMTEEYKAYLSDAEAVSFGNTNQVLDDLENDSITWMGKSLSLESKVCLKFIFDPKNYTGDLSALNLRVSYTDVDGATKNLTLENAELYNSELGLYTFTLEALLAAELRSVVSVQIYAGEIPVSCTLQYSADTYGNNKTGTLLELCKALFAYSDSAKAFFS